MYRNTPLGIALFEAIFELLDESFLTKKQAVMLVQQYDYSLRKVMRESYNDCSTFSFKAGKLEVYRCVDDHRHMVFRDVFVYQHFPPYVVQSYLQRMNWNRNPDQSSPTQLMSKGRKTILIKKMQQHDVQVRVAVVPVMVLIARCPVVLNANNVFYDRELGKCFVQEHPFNTNPRIELISLLTMRDPGERMILDQEDDNVIPAPMLNRYRSSKMIQDAAQPVSSSTPQNRGGVESTKFNYKYTFDSAKRLKKTQEADGESKPEGFTIKVSRPRNLAAVLKKTDADEEDSKI